MAKKFIGYIPARGDKDGFNYKPAKVEEFQSHDSAKTYVGRELLANPDVDEGFVYRLESKVQLKKLLADHTVVTDMR